MINDRKLQHAYDILHGNPWRNRDDLVDTLTYLAEFHKALSREYYDESKLKDFSKKILTFFQTELSKNVDLKSNLSNYESLDVAARKQVILDIYEILKKYASPNFDDLIILFKEEDTRVTARTDRDKTVTFFNVGTSSRFTNPKRVFNVVVHEFVHLMQSLELTTLPKDAVELARKYYCSFASFDKFDVKELASKFWENNINEKEAIFVGEYCEDNVEL